MAVKPATHYYLETFHTPHNIPQNVEEKLREAIRDVHDFPQPGIVFKDITPILGDHDLLTIVIDNLAALGADQGVSKVAGIDARGFIFAAAVAGTAYLSSTREVRPFE